MQKIIAHLLLRHLIHISVMVVILCSVVWAGVLTWIATGPRTMPYLSKQLERMLAGYAPGLTISIEDNVIQWNTLEAPVRINAKNIRVLDPNGDTLASIPELFIGLDPLYLLFFKPIPREIFVKDPMFYVEPSFAHTEETEKLEMARYYGYLQEVLAVMTRNQSQHTRLQHLGLRNAKVIFSTGDGEHLIWNLKKLEGTALKSEGMTVMDTTLDSILGDIPLELQFTMSLNDTGTLLIKTNFTQVSLAEITQNLPKTLYASVPFLTSSTLTTDGWVSFAYNASEQINDITVHLTNGKGSFADERLFKNPVAFDQLESDVHITGDFKTIDIHHASLRTDKATIGGNIGFQFDDDAFTVKLALESTNVPANRLDELWPVPLHPISRQWVIDHIAEGFSPRADVSFEIHHAYPKEEKEAVTTLVSLSSTVEVTGATVAYDPHFPPVTDVDATVTFSPEQMNVAVTKAKTLHSTIEHGAVKIPDFHATPLMLNVEGALKGKVEDMAAFYEPHKAKEEKTPILSADLSQITGDMDTAFSLSFPIDHTFSVDAIGFSVDTHATKVALPGILGKLNAHEGTLHLELDNKAATLDGQVMLGDIPTTLRLKKELTLHDDDPADKETGKYLFKFYVSGNELALFGAPAMPFIKDKFMVGLGITESKQQTDMVISADLTDTPIAWSVVGWDKPKGEPAFMEVAAFYKPDGPVRVPHFIVDSKHFSTKGDALFSPHFEKLEYITLEYLKTDKTDIRARYINTDKGYQLLISGDMLDARGFALGDVMSSSKKEPDYTDIRIQIAKVLMQHDEVFYDLNGTVFCAISGCVTAELSARLDDEGHDMSVSYQPTGEGKYALIVESNDGGKVLRGLGIIQNTKGGSLRIDAVSYRDPKKDVLIIEGEGILRAFTAVDTPIFTKILTLASFSGIGDLLTQSGIPFQRFDLPFRFEDGVLFIKDGNGHGSSIGMTLAGKVNTREKHVDLEGVLVPASNINRAIEQVPVVGEIITGGKGEGLIAARYSVKGSYDDPSVLVNPLSILTPGVLRKIFDIF